MEVFTLWMKIHVRMPRRVFSTDCFIALVIIVALFIIWIKFKDNAVNRIVENIQSDDIIAGKLDSFFVFLLSK